MFKNTILRILMLYFGAIILFIIIAYFANLFSSNNILIDLKSVILGLITFGIPYLACFYYTFRNQRLNLTPGNVFYNLVYGLIFKYFLMILIFVFIFKFIEINSLIFIISFIFFLIIQNIFTCLIYKH